MRRFLVHADWSVAARGRWASSATLTGSETRLAGPVEVTEPAELVELLFARAAAGEAVLAGFDFPIGVPIAYGMRTGLPDFRALLAHAGKGAWQRFFDVAERPEEIGLRRPFYPLRSTGEARIAALLSGLGFSARASLLRRCDYMPGRFRASELFWTLGAKQVGKAALHGWRTVIRPALGRGARLWPFEGDLAALLVPGAVVLAETYPAAAGLQTGLVLRGGKTDRARRAAMAGAVFGHMARHGISVEPGLVAALQDGFGTDRSGADRYDSLIGLLGMIEVAAGRLAAGAPEPGPESSWEGWILGERRSGDAEAAGPLARSGVSPASSWP